MLFQRAWARVPENFQPPVMLPQPAPKGLTRLLKMPVVPEPVVSAGMRPNLSSPKRFDLRPSEASRSKI